MIRFFRDGWKGHHIINSNPFKNVRVRDSCFFHKMKEHFGVAPHEKIARLFGTPRDVHWAPLCQNEHEAMMSYHSSGTQFVQTLWLGVHFPSVDEPQQTEKWWGIPGYGGHLRPYLSVTCDPTPLKPETRSLATLPLFTAPTTQNYTWSLATLPTTTRENTTRSLATLPTQIGRVTSDH